MDADIATVQSDPYQFTGDAQGKMTVRVNQTPINVINRVSTTAEKTATIKKGNGIAGVSDLAVTLAASEKKCIVIESSKFKKGRWNPEEHERFLKGCYEYKNDWKKVLFYLIKYRLKIILKHVRFRRYAHMPRSTLLKYAGNTR